MVVIDKSTDTFVSGVKEEVSDLHKVQEIILQKSQLSPSNEFSQKSIENFPPKINIKRIKRLLLIFLKQFDVDEYKFLIKFLDILFIKYSDDPMKLLVYLTNSSKENKSTASKFIETPKLKDSLSHLEEDEDITYLDEYKSDIIESFLMKENDEEQTENQLNKSQISEEASDNDQEDHFNDFNYYYHNVEIDNEKDDDGEDESVSDEYDENETIKKKSNTTTAKLGQRKFSDRIRNELEKKFLKNNFVSGPEKSKIAKMLNLTERQVQKWFVHRREKLRRRTRDSETLNENIDSDYRETKQSLGIEGLDSKVQIQKSMNDELLHEDEESCFNKRRQIMKKKNYSSKKHQDNYSRYVNRSLRPKQAISYEEETLKTPPAKRKCNIERSSKPSLDQSVCKSRSRRLVSRNAF